MTATGAFEWTKVSFGPGVTVACVHECGLAALSKPAGVLSHPNAPDEKGRSLIDAGYDEDKECYTWWDAEGKQRNVWLLHRLDSATSGVILVSSSEDMASTIRRAFEKREVRKIYAAVVFGHVRERGIIWRDTMSVRRSEGKLRASVEGGLRVETVVRRLRMIPGPPAMSVLELEPRTGRTHQLRHQCAQRSFPILGDQTYGNFRLNREIRRRIGTDRLFLHARKIEVELPFGGREVRFAAEAPLPPEFDALTKPGS